MKLQLSGKFALLGTSIALALIPNVSVWAQQAPTPSASENSPSDQDKDTNPNAAAGDSKPVKLSPFEVQASNTSGYGVKTTTSASRVAVNYIDVPQTVNVVTSEFITDFNVEDNRVLFQFIPNISESQGQYLVIRGISTDAMYIDGVPVGNDRTVMPLQFYDRVEIVKGPSSAAFGLGEPAGLINYVSKMPSGRTDSTLTLGIGDYDNEFFNFDTEGRSIKYDKLTYRLVTFGEKGYQQVRSQGQHSGAGAQLTLRDEINQTTDLELITGYASTRGLAVTDVTGFFKSQTGIDLLADYGLPKLPQVLGKNVDLVPKGWGNYVDANNFRINLILNKSLFDEHIHFRNGLTISNDVEPNRYWGAIDNIFNPSPGVYTTGIDRYHFAQNSNSFTENFDVDALFEVKGVKLRTLLGGLYRQQSADNEADGPPDLNLDGTQAVVNIYHPDLSAIPIPTAPITDVHGNVTQPLLHYWNNNSKGFQYGYYVQEEASFFHDSVTAMAGWRIDYFHNYSHVGLNNVTSSPGWQNTKGAPRYSLSYKPTNWLSAYFLYTVHNDPTLYAQKYVLVQRGSITQATIDKYDNFQDQLAYQPGGHLTEAGLKANFFNDRLTLSLAAFHELAGNTIQPSGISITNSDGSITTISDYNITDLSVHGIEAEIFGQPTRRLSFIANYGRAAGLNAGSTKAAPLYIDPPTTVSLHGKYDFGDLHGNGLYVTFGGIHYGGYWLSAAAPYVYWSKSQYSLDGGIGYKWDHGRETLYFNVNNFTDQYNTLGSVAAYNAGPREQAFLSYTIKF